jgi:hypothetical protein
MPPDEERHERWTLRTSSIRPSLSRGSSATTPIRRSTRLGPSSSRGDEGWNHAGSLQDHPVLAVEKTNRPLFDLLGELKDRLGLRRRHA